MMAPSKYPTQTCFGLDSPFQRIEASGQLSVAMVGDLKYGRVHSLTQALAKFDGNRFLLYRAGCGNAAIALIMLDEEIAWSSRLYCRSDGGSRHPIHDPRQKERRGPSSTPTIAQFVLPAPAIPVPKPICKCSSAAAC